VPLKQLMILFYILIALTPFVNPPIVWRLLGSTGTFKVLGALCVVYAMIDITRRGSIPAYFRTWQARLFTALVVLASFSFFTMGSGLFVQNTTLLIYIDFVVFFFVTIAVVNSPSRLRWVLLAAVVGIAYGSADIIREWLYFHNSMAGYRAGDSVGDGNYFSTSAALILPFVFLMIFHARKLSGKLFFSGCLLISLVAIMLTGSRGGALAVAVSFLYVIWHSRHRVRNLALLGVLILPLAIFLPASPVQRFLHPTAHGINTEQTRLWAWMAGLRMFETHPFLGVGLGNFKPLMPVYATPGVDFKSIAHNTYIEYLAELGPAGLFLFVAIASCSFRSLRRVRMQSRSTGPPSVLYLAALALESGLLGYLVGAIFLSAEYEKLYWMVIFLSICLPGMMRPVRAEFQNFAIGTSTTQVSLQEHY
jgi:O-antigen ligase